ncbi:hypothetical protein H2201_000321 [Coniosporium apollinis]|uniref:Uncharacterized protein n=2 Tax=Coniosporium TaxID=2810619 RepID=A0ABQ9P791_9PEZI|nr:hypothetical protein H2199_003510 [Cladosporium sp. JES 115]KAJ9669454.1 hypothetical protein H2201_000321 [Coniosporium apollinis]
MNMNQGNKAASGIDGTPTGNPSLQSQDPFASQRSSDNDPFAGDKLGDLAGPDSMKMASSQGSPPRDRRMSKEWDASKVPPSRFQKREGSIYSTPSSRDGHTRSRDEAYHAKLKEKGWTK